MKVDQQLLESQQQVAQPHSHPHPHPPSYFMWEQHNVTLFKNPNYGYGIAISGGLCANNLDSLIHISDIVPGGPAENKLMIDDIILSVNGVNVENVEHSFVIRLLKEAKDFIHLVIKRKLSNSNGQPVLMTNGNMNGTLTKRTANESNDHHHHHHQQRHNLAIQQTAATVMANYANSFQNGPNNNNNTNNNSALKNGSSNNLMSIMMNSSTSMSSMKPIKISLNKRDKKDTFGIVLGCKYYIKEILPNSLASNEPSLKKGDILVKLNDMTVDQFSLSEANKLIIKAKESKLNLVVKRNSVSSSEDEELIDDLTCVPNNGKTAKPDSVDKADSQARSQSAHQLPTNSANAAPVSVPSTPNTQPQAPPQAPPPQPAQPPQPKQPATQIKQLFKPIKTNNVSNDRKFFSNKNVPLNYRTVVFAKENGIGIRLAGGNKVGIFICDVQYNSPAERAGLRIGDKIIKVNGIDYLSLTREEAVNNMLNSTHSLIEMVVAHTPDEYEANAFDPLGGDSFYVRCHFNYTSKNANDINFAINDILHVTDTLYNGVIGQWVGSKLDSGEDARGTMPNETSAEKLVSNAPTIDQLYSINNPNGSGESSTTNDLKSIGASARMSIRMKLAGRNGLAKRSKSASRTNGAPGSDNESNSNVNPNVKVSKPNTFHSDKYHTYERIVLKEVNFVRPIVIFGPLADVAREKLKSEFPNKYEIPESYSTDPNDAANSQASGVIKLASIKSIIEKGKHCLLDITPNAVDHLNYAQYFPICVYLKAQSRNHTKELRQKYAKNLKTKSSKRLYDNALKLQTYYSHLFTGTVPLDSNQWFKKLKDLIEQQQSQPLWISQDLDRLLNEQHQQQPTSDNQPQLPTATSQPQNLLHHLHVHQPPPPHNPSLLLQADIQQQTKQQINNRFNIFDDNFEFPIYTTANQLSTSGAASSTYSLYEENNNNYNNRSSIAASDSDLCSSIGQHPPHKLLYSNEHQIYSTNFKNGDTTAIKPVPQPQQVSVGQASPTSLQRVKSDPSLALVNGQNHPSQDGYVEYPTSQQAAASNVENWKKFATYSANSLRSLSNGLLMDQNGMFYQKTSNSSTPTKTANGTTTTPVKSRPLLNDVDFVQFNYASHDGQMKRSSTSDHYNNNNNDPFSPTRNGYVNATGAYKLIKNSQSSLMPDQGKAIVDQSMIFNQSGQSNYVQQSQSMVSNGSLLQPIKQNDSGIESKMNDLKISTTNGNGYFAKANQPNKHKYGQCIEPSQQHDLTDSSPNTSDLARPMKNGIQSNYSTITNNNGSNKTMSNGNYGMMNKSNEMACLIKRKKELQSPNRPPPTLPKPKFILPQTSATSLVLQRNLKAKSELNIATPSNFSSSSAVCSSSSTSSASSSSSSTHTNENNLDAEVPLIMRHHIHQQQQQQQQQQQLQYGTLMSAKQSTPYQQAQQQQPLRNKLLENNSIVSSSQGYHSDTWESHSSRQSFDMDLTATATNHVHYRKVSSSKLAGESKLAKKTLLTNVENNISDGSMNGIVSSSDDTDSMPNEQNQFYQKNTPIHLQKPTNSSSSTVSTSSSNNGCNSSSSPSTSSSSAVALSAATTLSSNFSNANCTLTSNNNNINNNNTSANHDTSNVLNDSTSKKRMSASNNESIELPIYYQTSQNENYQLTPLNNNSSNNNSFNNSNRYSDLYSNDLVKYRSNTYTAHYNDNGVYKKLSLDSNSNCSIIASANGIFDSNGGILESADTGVSLNVPEGAIAEGVSFDLYFKVCHCKTNIINGKGEQLTNPIVMCGPRTIKFLKPVELKIPHFISLDGQSWSYAFKTTETISDDDPYAWNVSRFAKKTLINSVTVLIDSF